MKKIIEKSYWALVLSLALFACKADEVVNSLNSPLVGTTWTLTSEMATNCTDSNDNYPSTPCSSGCDVVILNADGTISVTENGTPIPVTINYTSTGTTITASYNDGSGLVTEVIGYTIVLNQLTLVHPADPDDGCIRTEVYVGS